jgi:site-specific DNA-cytosine methylase
MDDGISSWPHRLKQCGNAVVPQIPEMIGYAILEAERVKHIQDKLI